MTKNFKMPIVASATFAVLMSMSAPVLAEPSLSTGRTSIIYRDIDVSTAHGQVQLQNRINVAIRDLCGEPAFGTREEAEMLRQCRDEARANAEPKLRAILAAASVKIASNR